MKAHPTSEPRSSSSSLTSRCASSGPARTSTRSAPACGRTRRSSCTCVPSSIAVTQWAQVQLARFECLQKLTPFAPGELDCLVLPAQQHIFIEFPHVVDVLLLSSCLLRTFWITARLPADQCARILAAHVELNRYHRPCVAVIPGACANVDRIRACLRTRRSSRTCVLSSIAVTSRALVQLARLEHLRSSALSCSPSSAAFIEVQPPCPDPRRAPGRACTRDQSLRKDTSLTRTCVPLSSAASTAGRAPPRRGLRDRRRDHRHSRATHVLHPRPVRVGAVLDHGAGPPGRCALREAGATECEACVLPVTCHARISALENQGIEVQFRREHERWLARVS
ncbi:hypothetical protein DFH06DRAFT_1239731 [Mycena polygramma]|nr:hypothetical protein DFH06DRAFT_1239731 [Mycena polygramma]